MIEQKRRLRCFGCSKPIELPHLRPQQEATDAWPITVVCRNCGRQASYSIQDIRHEQILASDQSIQIDVLWCVTFQCAYQNCAAQKRQIYTSCEHFLIDDAPHFVLGSKEAVCCENGHPFRIDNLDSVYHVTNI